jgi:Ca2+-binding RTX toxin-like protein
MPHRLRLQLETLESRTVLASAIFAEGVVTISGTPNADVLRIWQDQGDLVIDGAAFRIAADQVQRIEAMLGESDDQLANETAIPLTAWGGGGSDILRGGSGNDVLYGEDRKDQLYGGDGDDTLVGGGGTFGVSDYLEGGAGVDTLEGQQVIDLVWSDNNGRLFLSATPGPDRLTISQSDSKWVLNGAVTPWTSSRVTVYGLGGDDLIINQSEVGITIDGGDGRDRLFGGSGNDTLIGGLGSDLYLGRQGDDKFVLSEATGAAEREIILDTRGGNNELDFSAVTVDASFQGNSSQLEHAGRSLRYFGGVPTIIRSGSGNDIITAHTDIAQQLFGGAGNDILTGGNGDDTLDGGTGDDLLRGGAGNDQYAFGAAATANEIDQIDDADQTNGLKFDYGRSKPVRVDLNAPVEIVADNVRTIRHNGTRFTDFWTGIGFVNIIGTPRADVIRATGVNSTDSGYYIDGGDGDDAIELSIEGTAFGGAGNDVLKAGNFFGIQLSGGDGNDWLQGGNNNDVLAGGAGDDTLDGGAGSDRFIFGATNGLHETDTILDTDGSNGLDFSGDENGLNVDLGAPLAVSVSPGRTVNRQSAGFYEFWGSGKVRGTEASDTIFLHGPTDSGYYIVEALGGDDTIISFAGGDLTVYGGTGNDKITGGYQSNRLFGEDGNDIIDTKGKQNTIEGGAGNDVLTGGTYHDYIDGGAGNDTIYGDGLAQANNYSPAQFSDTLIGGDGNDTINGELGHDYIEGGAGNDILNGGWDDDELWGGSGNDTLHGNEGNDKLSGDAGVDRLYGDSGYNTITADADDTAIVP